MWETLDKPWQEAFKMAWDSYKKGSLPIGCVIVNRDEAIISKGRNQIFDNTSDSPLAGTNMAHAEMDALIGLNEIHHPEIRSYILYTTLEPCPMCFGTAIMMHIRNINYAADDGLAGASSLNDKLDYIKNKGLNIRKFGGELEAFQLILQTAFEYERKSPRIDKILNAWRDVNYLAVEYGGKLHKSGYFKDAIKSNKAIGEVYNEVIEKYNDRNINQ